MRVGFIWRKPVLTSAVCVGHRWLRWIRWTNNVEQCELKLATSPDCVMWRLTRVKCDKTVYFHVNFSKNSRFKTKQLILWDKTLSAAFDCVHHQLLLQRLRHDFGLTDTVLAWMTSFATGRSQQVVCKNQLSTVQPVQNGVPQGSVLGPILFVLYTAEIGRIVARHGLGFRQYADNCQIYVATSVTIYIPLTAL